MERLLVIRLLHHLNKDTNLQARFSVFQYEFRTGVSIETALHEFVRRMESSLAKKKTALGIFLDVVGAFFNITHKSIGLRELEVSPFLVSWIENSLQHRTVRVELNDEVVKREVLKFPILSPFVCNCVFNSLLIEPCNKDFCVQADADDVAILVTGTDMRWIKSRAQKALNIATNWASTQDLQFSGKKMK